MSPWEVLSLDRRYTRLQRSHHALRRKRLYRHQHHLSGEGRKRPSVGDRCQNGTCMVETWERRSWSVLLQARSDSRREKVAAMYAGSQTSSFLTQGMYRFTATFNEVGNSSVVKSHLPSQPTAPLTFPLCGRDRGRIKHRKGGDAGDLFEREISITRHRGQHPSWRILMGVDAQCLGRTVEREKMS